ncbi:MAG: NrfD/PsrC family molybdoenzyme membrane anchor subunit [Syntrophorhabdaceae bacterium]
MNTTTLSAGNERFEERWVGPGIKEDYYGLPSLKHSHYRWTAGGSFFLAGIAGTCQILTTIIDLVGDERERPIVRAGRYLVPLAASTAALLYIKDLGTPRRWFNMLRIYRPTSFMSIGSWSLTALGAGGGVTALIQLLGDLGYKGKTRVLARLSSLPALVPGSLVSFYMGTELEETSTPFWASSTPIFPSLFVATNTANTLSIFELVSLWRDTGEASRMRLGTLSLMAGVAELLLLKKVESKWLDTKGNDALYDLHRKLLHRTGFITLAKVFGMLLRSLSLYRRSGPLLSIACCVTLVTGFFLPVILLLAGNKSADRPLDYFSQTVNPDPLPLISGSAKKRRYKPQRGKRSGKSLLRWVTLGLGVVATAGLFYLASTKPGLKRKIGIPERTHRGDFHA